jgi:hypothetical protein
LYFKYQILKPEQNNTSAVAAAATLNPLRYQQYLKYQGGPSTAAVQLWQP